MKTFSTLFYAKLSPMKKGTVNMKTSQPQP